MVHLHKRYQAASAKAMHGLKSRVRNADTKRIDVSPTRADLAEAVVAAVRPRGSEMHPTTTVPGRFCRPNRRQPILGALLAGCLALSAVASSSPASGVAGFGDVAAGTFFTPAVQWMVDREITTGTTATCYSPHDPVTRGQAAALIWRMEGEPTAPAHAFDDVVAGWQQGAVSWMADEGITTGTSSSTFSPEVPVTRAQLAAFLHRLAGRPAAPAHPFSDIGASWQQAPVAWMVANRITTGTSPTTFSPESMASRGEIATFLYRYSGSPAVTIDASHPASADCVNQVASDISARSEVRNINAFAKHTPQDGQVDRVGYSRIPIGS